MTHGAAAGLSRRRIVYGSWRGCLHHVKIKGRAWARKYASALYSLRGINCPGIKTDNYASACVCQLLSIMQLHARPITFETTSLFIHNSAAEYISRRFFWIWNLTCWLKLWEFEILNVYVIFWGYVFGILVRTWVTFPAKWRVIIGSRRF